MSNITTVTANQNPGNGKRSCHRQGEISFSQNARYQHIWLLVAPFTPEACYFLSSKEHKAFCLHRYLDSPQALSIASVNTEMVSYPVDSFNQVLSRMPLDKVKSLFFLAISQRQSPMMYRFTQCQPFADMFIWEVGEFLTKAAKEGKVEEVKCLMNCSRFTEIFPVTLGSGLEEAAKNGHVEIVELFIQCSQFTKIPKIHVKRALEEIIKQRKNKATAKLPPRS